MKKKLTVLLLAALMAFGGVVTAYAEPETTTKEEGISPAYEDIASILYGFKIFSDGEAYYTADVDTSSSTKIKCYMELQYKTGGSWEKIKGATYTRYSSSYEFTDSEYLDETGDYRVYYEITAYYGNGKSETTSKYKYATY